MSKNERYCGSVLRLALAAIGVGAIAMPAIAADTKSGQLEEIVVTATRHEESLSKVPLSVTAISQEALDAKGIKDFADIVRFTPGVTIDTSGTNAISIRGISSSGGAGTTGIYIDDTPIQMRALGFNPDDALPKTFDLDRVEVLRGPQGTLFGAGSEGGTVRYIMAQPSLTKESTYVRSEISSTKGGEPSYEAGIAHGGPLIDNVLGYRASVWYRYDGGYIDRVDPTSGAVVDKNANHANTMAARLAFIWRPADNLTVTPSFMYQNSRKHDQSTYWPAYSNGDHLASGSPERNPVPDEFYLPALKVDVDLGKVRFISNTSYFHRDEKTAYYGSVYDLAYFQSLSWVDLTLTGAPPQCGSASTTTTAQCSWYPLIDANGIHLPPGLAGYATPNPMVTQQRSVTQEFRLQSNDDTSRFKWTVGAFWSLTQETSIEQLIDSQLQRNLDGLFGYTNDVYLNYFYNTQAFWWSCGTQSIGTVDPSWPAMPDCAIYYNKNTSHDRQLAGFGDVTYSVTDQLKLSAGGRYARMSFDLSHYANGLENFGPGSFSGEVTQTTFTPKLGLSFQANPQDLYYLTYAKGFRPGGVNAPLPPAFCPPAPSTFGPDTTQSFELGSKNGFGPQLRLATSVYYIKWQAIQQNVYVPGSCGLQYTDNLGTAVAKGFDMQLEAVVGGGLSFDVSVGYTSARFTESTSRVQSGDAISGEAAINYSPGTNPPWNAAVGAQYNFSLASRDAFVRLDWEYTSRNPWLAAVQDPNTSQYNPNAYSLPATSFASLRAGVTFGNWAVSAFIDNLFDTKTITNYAQVQVDGNNPNYDQTQPQSVQSNLYGFRPRTVGLTLNYRL